MPAGTNLSQLPKDLNISSLKKVQDELAMYNREISRCKETLISLADEVTDIEQRLASIDQRYVDLYLKVSSLHERAKVMMTLKVIHTALENNLSKPGFARILRTQGKGNVVRRLTYVESPMLSEVSEDGTSSVASQLPEWIDEDPENELEERIGDVIALAKEFLAPLSEMLLQLYSFEIRAVNIKTQFEGPLITEIERRRKGLKQMKQAHQDYLLRCIMHETAISDFQKVLKPTQTLDQFLAAERYNLDHKKECQSRERQLELLVSAIKSRVREVSHLKVKTEDLATNVGKDLNPYSVNLRIPATAGDVELPDDLSSLDLGDTARPSRLLSFDQESEEYYLKKIDELRKLLNDEGTKAQRSQFSLQMKEEQVTASKEKLSGQKLKGMYFVFMHYFSLLSAKALRRWRLKTAEISRSAENEKIMRKLILVVGGCRRDALEWVWDKLSGQEDLQEDKP